MAMRQAIQTKYFGPGNVRGARVKAIADCNGKESTLTLGWDHSKGFEDNHKAAAHALATKLGWKGDWIGGALPGSGYAFVTYDDIERAFGVT